MREISRRHDKCDRIALAYRLGPDHAPSTGASLTPELLKYLHILGPTPKRTLEALADLGLSDDEIARYFSMPCHLVTRLREFWKIDGSSDFF
ncbi:hypothetical protein [Yoonia sediminilitoris]|uniref:Uncharacterized protein n=1 Tax=Yoonia sediminilitoris TaxID=1286148 RepID=A0A2T6KBY6_9RHOB|nr:hypothetical protein [Yoonia sediminilitoris]PUB12431.1 hypothetical protein C8N45_11070 [Yoonia sediminilitoris]RCW93125.1 hypothetical protein DFP92_11070 [Yoonia sediminilitoris]